MASHALKPHFMSIPQDHLGLLVSLPESVSLLAVNWHTGGQHQIRKPRGPWLCALLPYMDMPVGWPRNDGLMGLQHCSAQLPRVTTQAGTLDPSLSPSQLPPDWLWSRGGASLQNHPGQQHKVMAKSLMGHNGTCALASVQPHTLGPVSSLLWTSQFVQ